MKSIQSPQNCTKATALIYSHSDHQNTQKILTFPVLTSLFCAFRMRLCLSNTSLGGMHNAVILTKKPVDSSSHLVTTAPFSKAESERSSKAQSMRSRSQSRILSCEVFQNKRILSQLSAIVSAEVLAESVEKFKIAGFVQHFLKVHDTKRLPKRQRATAK